MEFPKAFNKLLRQIDEEFFVKGGTWEESLQPKMEHLSESERFEVRQFLGDRVSGPFDVAEVERLLQKSGAQLGVANAEEAMPSVLADIRGAIVRYRGRQR